MTEDIERPDPWLDRLSDYVDGELRRRERRALEAHLRACPTCVSIVGDLRRVVAEAQALRTDSEPAADLWPGIEQRLAPRRPAARHSWLVLLPVGFGPRLAAAAGAAVLVAVAGLVWFTPSGASLRTRDSARSAIQVSGVLSDYDEQYDSRVAALERAARARLTLDPSVVDVLEENLATLDVAIANYRGALSKQPGDTAMRQRLEAARNRKLEVLQHVVALAPEGTN
jgi:anti-sigma factor RsiW